MSALARMNAKQKKLLAIGVALLLFAALKGALIYYWYQHRDSVAKPVAAVPAAAQQLSCNPEQGCALPGGGTLRFVGPVQPGKPFAVELNGVAAAAAPQLTFAMLDMDMGFNRYTLVQQGSGWGGQVTLPVCHTGRADWQAELALNGQVFRVKFATG